MNKPKLRQTQEIVSPNSATFENLGKGMHYGQIFCSFCSKPTIVAGPKVGKGVAWIHSTCRHSQGIAAGAGYDITVLFSGYDIDDYSYEPKGC